MLNAITVDGLSKRYQIGPGMGAGLISASIGNWLRGSSSPKDLWALDDVCFEVPEGEVFGIVGRNGSGKSTLLKILAGIVRPTRGTAAVRGRVGALLEVGTGFHPQLSGRENVYFNGALLGMPRAEISAKFDEIVAFSGLEKFIDTPIKYYSSGMHARLGFAVAAHLKPEILIIDEVLSVGDVLFQQKSLERMGDLTRSGITALFVSHNLGSVAAVCSRGLLLDSGHITAIGKIYDVLNSYIVRGDARDAKVTFDLNSESPAPFHFAQLEHADGTPTTEFDMTDDIWLRMRYSIKVPLAALQLTVLLRAGYEDLAQSFDTDADAYLGTHPPGVFERRMRINKMFLKEGRYSVSVFTGIPTELFDNHSDVLAFDVVAHSLDTQSKSFRRDRQGRVVFQGEWTEAVDQKQ